MTFRVLQAVKRHLHLYGRICETHLVTTGLRYLTPAALNTEIGRWHGDTEIILEVCFAQ